MNPVTPIYFYLPPADFPPAVPETTDHYWIGFRKGIYCWTLQTYLNLRNSGFSCVLVNEIPEEGVILAHWDSLPPDLQPTARQLLICIQADRARHAFAQVHIVQNPYGLRRDLMVLGDRYLLAGRDYFMPHWPQPGLIPRDGQRGDQFENLYFFGLECNLLPDFKTPQWAENLQSLGIQWRVRSAFETWHDYRDVDGILAVRNFQATDFLSKPAAKLYNAWHAGVPAILGRESAFRAERKSNLDYLEVGSLQETLAALAHLQNDPLLRSQMVANGIQRATETAKPVLTERWSRLLTQELSPYWQLWRQSTGYRQQFLARRRMALETRALRKQLQFTRNALGLRTRLRNTIQQLPHRP